MRNQEKLAREAWRVATENIDSPDLHRVDAAVSASHGDNGDAIFDYSNQPEWTERRGDTIK